MAASDPTVTVTHQSEMPGGWSGTLRGRSPPPIRTSRPVSTTVSICRPTSFRGRPRVVVLSASNTGYVPAHNNGTAAAGTGVDL